MEPRNAFEKTLQDKFAGFAPEPSDKVWQNVRKQIGPKPQGPWANILGMTMVGITAGFFLLNFTSSPALPTLPVTEMAPLAQAQPTPKVQEEIATSLVENEKVAEEPVSNPAPPTLVTVARTPQRATNLTQKETVKATPTQLQVTDSKEAVVKTLPSPAQIAAALPKTETRSLPIAEENAVEQPAMQQGENFVMEGKQTQRGKLLHKVAEVAEKNLGIETDYSEKQYNDYTKTSFSADLKFLKIKRVKTRKND